MSRQSRLRTRGHGKGPHSRQWKLIDDHSGFEVMSSDVKIDHRGRITSKDNFDSIHYSELPITFPTDLPIPFSRPEPMDWINVQPPYRAGFIGSSGDLPPTYLDHYTPQSGFVQLLELNSTWNNNTYLWNLSGNPSGNANMSFCDKLFPMTFGPLVDQGDIIDTGTFKSWGDNYTYFNLGRNITQGSAQDMLYPAYINTSRNVG